ncbi:hypothetical protein BDQ12DRAFT_666771 [Crucibulum laeve]|uniref:Uncharacterized protein n=1 Tax=Crucibulum laeve TaxID=68775 RepID=A0A5C3LXK1_9AGAR|nr:hypothetical protein BDQ12DRAFT_666771 [Crucibulum laeve]
MPLSLKMDCILNHRNDSKEKSLLTTSGKLTINYIRLDISFSLITALTKKEIKVFVDLPDIGQNLQDHPLLLNHFKVDTTTTFDAISTNPNTTANVLKEWSVTHQSQFADSLCNNLGFIRLDKSFFHGKVDPSGMIYLLYDLKPDILRRTSSPVAMAKATPAVGNFITDRSMFRRLLKQLNLFANFVTFPYGMKWGVVALMLLVKGTPGLQPLIQLLIQSDLSIS